MNILYLDSKKYPLETDLKYSSTWGAGQQSKEHLDHFQGTLWLMENFCGVTLINSYKIIVM